MCAGSCRAILAVLILAGTGWAQEEQRGLDQALATSRKTGRPLLAIISSGS